MKKLLICFMIILLFGGIFGIAIQSSNNSIKEDMPVISSVLECLVPAAAYADPDTALPLEPNPQPPIPIDPNEG